MTVVFEDTFTEGSDTVLESHSPDTGTGWTDVGADGIGATVIAATDHVECDSSNGSSQTGYTAIYTVGTPDYDVEFDVLGEGAGDNPVGAFARYTDTSNYWIYSLRNRGGKDCRIVKFVAGVRTAVSDVDTDNTWTAETSKFELRGDALKGFFGAVEEVTVVDSAHESVEGPGGLFWGDFDFSTDDTDTNWQIDNFKITEAAAGGGQPTMRRWGGTPGMTPGGTPGWT